MEAAREREVRVEHGPTRCPFCHESVAPAADDWVACSQCLGRHHSACWEEGAACAGCGHTGRLTAGEAQASPRAAERAFTPVEPPPGERPGDDVAHARRQVATHFDRKSRSEWWWLEGLVGPLTFGLLPLVANELRLKRRDAELAAKARPLPADLDPDLAQRIEAGRRRRLRASSLRGLFFGSVTLVALLTGLWGLIGGEALEHSYRSSWTYSDMSTSAYYEARHVYQLMVIWAWVGLTAAMTSYLHTARELVRAHELRQLFEALVLRAAPPAEADKVLKTAAEGWTLRRIIDTVLTVVAFIPFVGGLAWPFLCLRVGGALSLHDKHEELLDERVPPPRARAKGEGPGA